MNLTKKELCDIFEYNDGVLYWKKRLAHRIQIGDKAGSISHWGYVEIRVLGKMYKAHRIIFFIHHGYLPKNVDHIDRNRLNNQIENLRAASDGESVCNRTSAKGSASKYLGVFLSQEKYWYSRIGKNGKSKYIGMFKTEKDAAIAYNKAAIEIHGEYANLNIIQP